jgi:hypothetical protein
MFKTRELILNHQLTHSTVLTYTFTVAAVFFDCTDHNCILRSDRAENMRRFYGFFQFIKIRGKEVP